MNVEIVILMQNLLNIKKKNCIKAFNCKLQKSGHHFFKKQFREILLTREEYIHSKKNPCTSVYSRFESTLSFP